MQQTPDLQLAKKYNPAVPPWSAPRQTFKHRRRQPERFSLTIGPERMAGNTTYRIGYPTVDPSGVKESGYFPFSELKWPLDIWLLRTEAKLNINDSWRINASIKRNLSTPDSNMQDSDWVTDSDPGRLDVFSESSISRLDAWIFDIGADWIFVRQPSWSLYGGLGYQHQMFYYESNIIYQYSPSGLPGNEYYGDGRVSITYDITYSMPYMKIGGAYRFRDRFSLDGSFAWSPLVNARDEDNHLLRENGGKICKGNMDGNAYMVNLSARYNLNSAWFLKGGFNFAYIDVDGDQHQVYGNGMQIGTVRETSQSTQISGFLSLGYAF
ncbi:MAG TPA: omptin family outer membrane protease [Deltaproteobacteria bacterium]|nr:omptin family outer membrane protease [Deltaproteobacteria bacterium]